MRYKVFLLSNVEVKKLDDFEKIVFVAGAFLFQEIKNSHFKQGLVIESFVILDLLNTKRFAVDDVRTLIMQLLQLC